MDLCPRRLPFRSKLVGILDEQIRRTGSLLPFSCQPEMDLDTAAGREAVFGCRVTVNRKAQSLVEVHGRRYVPHSEDGGDPFHWSSVAEIGEGPNSQVPIADRQGRASER